MGATGVAYSFDRWWMRRPDRFGELPDRLFQWHREDLHPHLPSYRWTRDWLADAHQPLGHRLPPALVDRRVVYHSAVLAYSTHLPDGWFRRGLVPLLVERDTETPTALIVPQDFWPEHLLDWWRASA